MPASVDAGIFVMGFVKGQSRDQAQLFPERLDDLVDANSPCRVIDAFVGHLDLAATGFVKAQSAATGRPPYDPADLLKLYLYGYLNRVRSSRRLERECQRNVEVMWLLNRLAPDHKTIAEFRRLNGKGVRRAGAAFVSFCRDAGLIKGDWIAIDGSKFKAVASGKAVIDQQWLEQQMEAYLQGLDQTDTTEQGNILSPTEIQAALSTLAEQGSSRWVSTEPDARVLKGQGPAYNVQIATDAEHALIVSHAVTAEATDNRSLQPMAEAVSDSLSRTSFCVIADAGYSNGEQAAALEARGIVPHAPANRSANNKGDGTLFDRSHFHYQPATDCFICPAGQTLQRKQHYRPAKVFIYSARAQDCAVCPLKSQCTRSQQRNVSRHFFEDALMRMTQRCTPTVMRLRRSTVEHPFGTLKYNVFEKPRFLLRGLWSAGSEMALACLAYNMKRAIKVMGTREILARLAVA